MQFLGCHSKQESSGKPSSQDNILLQKYDHLSKGEKKQVFINIRPPTDPPAKKKSLRLFFDATDAYRDATAQIWESFLPNNLPSPPQMHQHTARSSPCSAMRKLWEMMSS